VKTCVATRLHGIDVSALFVHPACVVSLTLTMLRTESGRSSAGTRDVENIILNISGRLIMIPRELRLANDHDNNLVSSSKKNGLVNVRMYLRELGKTM